MQTFTQAQKLKTKRIINSLNALYKKYPEYGGKLKGVYLPKATFEEAYQIATEIYVYGNLTPRIISYDVVNLFERFNIPLDPNNERWF